MSFLALRLLKSLPQLLLTVMLSFASSVSLAGQFSDGRTFFDRSPTLVSFSATFQSVRTWGAKYYLTINLPSDLGEPLSKVTIQQKTSIQTIDFLLDQTFAFIGTREHQGQKLTLQSVTFDPNTSTITVIFDPPVPANTTVSIGLKPVRNPDYGGIYQFGITAYPPGKNSLGLSLGVARLAIYDTSDR